MSPPWRKPWVGSWLSQKSFSRRLVADDGRVEDDADGLGVAGAAGAHLVVRRVLREPAGVADGRGVDALGLPELALGAPEAAQAEDRDLVPGGPRAGHRRAQHGVGLVGPEQRVLVVGEGLRGGGHARLAAEQAHGGSLGCRGRWFGFTPYNLRAGRPVFRAGSYHLVTYRGCDVRIRRYCDFRMVHWWAGGTDGAEVHTETDGNTPSVPVQIGGGHAHHAIGEAAAWAMLIVMFIAVLFVGMAVIWVTAQKRSKTVARRRAARERRLAIEAAGRTPTRTTSTAETVTTTPTRLRRLPVRRVHRGGRRLRAAGLAWRDAPFPSGQVAGPAPAAPAAASRPRLALRRPSPRTPRPERRHGRDGRGGERSRRDQGDGHVRAGQAAEPAAEPARATTPGRPKPTPTKAPERPTPNRRAKQTAAKKATAKQSPAKKPPAKQGRHNKPSTNRAATPQTSPKPPNSLTSATTSRKSPAGKSPPPPPRPEPAPRARPRRNRRGPPRAPTRTRPADRVG